MGGRKRLVREPVPETQIDHDLLGFISDGAYCEPEHENPYPFFGVVEEGHEHIYEAWVKLRGSILTDWIKANPCSRPSLWWQLDAPRDQRQLNETQAHFLQRHNQLLTSEKRYLGKHPELLTKENDHE